MSGSLDMSFDVLGHSCFFLLFGDFWIGGIFGIKDILEVLDLLIYSNFVFFLISIFRGRTHR